MASSSSRRAYQVFLSFRGEDTRKNFTDHLYTALLNAGFHTFRDDDEVERGEDIASELEKAIRQSKISIVVFSKNYAFSRWCLDELANILERRKNAAHKVLPIFYHIDPSDVRKQVGTFAEAFVQHEKRFKAEMDKVEGWRTALREAADLAGMSLQNQANGHEAQFIKNIIEEIAKKLNQTVLSVPIYPIGLSSRVEEINRWLQDGSTGVGIGVICGMGGIGKTTIAKMVYNLNFVMFERSSFLANIREASEQPNGLVHLQKQLLLDILGKKRKVYNVDEGIIKIKDALCFKRVLLVLDDVDWLDQLDAILGMRDWLYPGSKIVITTRHERLLKAHEVCEKFKAKELNDDEALQLFSWHAFGQSHPIEAYMEHSRSVVRHCGGLPLALQVLSSSLSGKSLKVWESELQKLEAIPDGQILEKLRISYDSLQDHDQNLFLDIACFFIGKKNEYIITILDGCDFYTEAGLQNLIDRCLVTIGTNNKVMMHQLLRDMGREIIRLESPKEPGKRSRVWSHKDASNVLRKKTGTDTIEGLIFNLLKLKEDKPARAIFSWNPDTAFGKSSPVSNERDLDTDAFMKMQKLRLLQLNYVRLNGGYEDFPEELKWLCWRGFHLTSIPSNFPLQNLVALEMRNSSLKHVWKGNKFLKMLKILNLSHSHGLIKTPDFLGLPSLERLILKCCTSLVEVHGSIVSLKKLLHLNLKGCESLRKLPRNFCALTSLEKLDLSGCSKFDELPEGMEKMISLRMLVADGTARNQLSSMTGKLKEVSLATKLWDWLFWNWVSPRQGVRSTSFSSTSLARLILENCNLSDNAIPIDLSSLAPLQYLALSGNPIRSLPESIKALTMLQGLCLEYCTSLQSLLEFPTSLEELSVAQCTSFERMKNLPNSLEKLIDVPGFSKFEPVEIINNMRLLGLEYHDGSDLEMSSNLSLTPPREQKVVIEVSMDRNKCHSLVMEIAASISGVESAFLRGEDKNQLVVTGEGVDAVELTSLLRENVGYAELISVSSVEEKKERSGEKPPMVWPPPNELEEKTQRFIEKCQGDIDDLGDEDDDFWIKSKSEARKLPRDTSKTNERGKSVAASKQLRRRRKLTQDTLGNESTDSFKAVTTTSFDGEDDEPTEKLEAIERLAKKGSVRSRFLTFPTSKLKTLEKEGLGLTEAPDSKEWHDADRVLLNNNEFSKLPEEPICPKLIILSLRKNYKLRKIPSSFFINIPLLEHLDMSETGIMSLPKSLFELARLKRLILQDCQFLMMLPPEVGNLKCLEVLDSEGTEIINLPVEIKELAALRCLSVSLYGCIDNEWKSRQTNGMIPFGVISALSQLRDLTIGVNPEDERWNPCVEGIMNEFGGLTNLCALRLYFPRVELLRDLKWNDKSMIYSSLKTFRFIVGGHSKRVISRLPSNVDFELERWKWRKSLKYINGEGVPEDIKKVLKYATAFQLDRHMTVKKLTEFGIENMEHLKGCVLGECNEIQVIIDGNDIHNGQTLYESSGDRRIGLESLEFLYIYYMKNLKSIWEGPVDERPLSLLKSLTLSTCPQLITIFTVELLENLHNLQDLTVRDCPAIKSLVICEEAFKQSDNYLPNLRTISLHYVPELVTVSSEVCIAPNLEVLSLYNCPKLKCLSIKEVSSKHLRKIIGETDWWEALEWTQVQPNRFDGIFEPFNEDTCL